MKLSVWARILLAVLLIGFSKINSAEASTPLFAAPCTLEWDPSPDGAVGYALYCGVTGSGMTNRLDLGNTTIVTLSTLSPNVEYFFFVVAYNAEGVQSEPSNMMTYTPPMMSHFKIARQSDGKMKIDFRVGINVPCRVEYTLNLNPAEWTTLCNVAGDVDGFVSVTDPLVGNPPRRFYRVVGP